MPRTPILGHALRACPCPSASWRRSSPPSIIRIGTAFDEHGKLGAVRTGNYHYYHPLFMIDLAQAAAFVVQPPDLPSLAHLVRMLSARGRRRPRVCHLHSGKALAARPAILGGRGGRRGDAALHRACPPLQGGYFPRLPFSCSALAALIRLLQEPTQRRAILLGLLVGLAAGSKYVGVLILPFAVIAILLIPTPGPGQRWAESRDCHRHLDCYLSPRHAACDQAFRPLAERREFRASACDART